MAPKYTQAHYADFRPVDDKITEMLADMRWESSWRFLQSVQEQLRRRGSLSPRQVDVIEDIYVRGN